MPLLAPAQESAPAVVGAALSASVPTHRFVPSVRHLVRRPATREEFLLGNAVQGEYRFVLFDELPFTDPQFTGGQDPVDGLKFITRTLDEVARFVALRQLRIPRDRCVPRIAEASVDITDVEPWRLGGRRGEVVVDMNFRSLGAAGAPSGLECTATVSIDGTACATARSHLELSETAPPPAAGRPRLLSADLGQVRPARAGRTDSRDVVVHGRLVTPEHRVLMDVVPHPANPAYDPQRSDRAGSALLIEASRQAATLTVGELLGMSTSHCLLTRWTAEFPTGVDSGSPLRCSALPGNLSRDTTDRPVVPVRIEFTQDERCVGTVDVQVLQDC